MTDHPVCIDLARTRLHQRIMHDGPRRLSAFIEAMTAHQPDFIIN
jgi:hypothetical protein